MQNIQIFSNQKKFSKVAAKPDFTTDPFQYHAVSGNWGASTGMLSAQAKCPSGQAL